MYVYIYSQVSRENAKKYETKFVNIAPIGLVHTLFLFFRTYILSNRGKLLFILSIKTNYNKSDRLTDRPII